MEEEKKKGGIWPRQFILTEFSRLYAMNLSFCAVASGMPSQYNCRPPPSRQLELQLHGDFHKLTEAAPQLARSGAGL